MHIPNGFLTDPVCALTTAVSTVGIGASVARVLADRRAGRQQDPGLMAAVGAGMIAVQAINFNVDHGTSGHLLGAALATVVLGPARAMLTVTLVLCAQCFLLGDGGVSALGANILNMAIVATLTAGLAMRAATRWLPGRKGRLMGAALAGFGSVMAATLACSVELAAPGTHPLAQVAGAMFQVHWLVGISEAAITAAIVGLLAARAATTSTATPTTIGHSRRWSLPAAVAVVGVLVPLASPLPDGLTSVADEIGLVAAPGMALLTRLMEDPLTAICGASLAMTLTVAVAMATVYAAAYAVERRIG